MIQRFQLRRIRRTPGIISSGLEQDRIVQRGLLAVILALLLISCGQKRPVLELPEQQDPLPSPDEFVAQGDAQFSRMHLHGWREAEALYECAFEIKEEADTLEKLILTRFLLLTREAEEKIFRSSFREDLDFVCQRAEGSLQLTLCEIARNRLLLEGVLDEAPLLDLAPGVSRELLESRKKDSALDGYLYLLFLKDMAAYRLNEESERFQSEFPDSPLTYYLRSVQGGSSGPPIVSADPEFAELLMHSGERLVGQESYQEAITSLDRALELIPDYTNAAIALGDLFLFTFEYPKAALPHYEVALGVDPDNVRARFGEAVSQHYLGNHLESQNSLDRLLDKDLSRWRTVDRDAHPYYRGQSYYFRAYNYYLTGQKEEARQWVEKARELQPEADGPSYLSGLLNFENELFERAEEDFLKVIVKGTSLCDAYFRLGRIEESKKSGSALYHFIDNGSCLERNLAIVRRRIEEARQMRLEPGVRAAVEESFRQDLRKRLNDTIASVVSMINLAKAMEFIDTAEFQEEMEDRLARISVEFESQ